MQEFDPKKLENIFKSEFKFLEGDGYSYKRFTESVQDLLGRSCILVWENSSKKRALKAKYYESDSQNSMGTLIIEIVSLEPPKLSDDDYTSLPSRDVNIPRLRELHGSFEDRIQSCIELTKEQLDRQLSSILKGNTWIADKINWSGNK